MKKMILRTLPILAGLLLMAIMPLSVSAESTAPDEARFQELIGTNTGKAILSRHNNLQMDRNYFFDEKELYSVYMYRDANTYLESYSDGFASIIQADLCVDQNVDEEGAYYVEYMFDSVDVCVSTFESFRDSALLNIMDTEKLVETIDEGDGKFVAVTEISDPETLQGQLQESEAMGGYAYADGMVLRAQHTFDAETGDLLSIDTYLLDADGESHLFETDSFAYDVETYDPGKEGEPFANYWNAEENPDEMRAIEVTFAPDTADENMIRYILPYNTYFEIIRNGNYAEEIYLDRACTQLFEESDGTEDLSLYVK